MQIRVWIELILSWLTHVQANIKKKIANEPMEPMHPWFKGFRGTIDLQVNKKGEVGSLPHLHVYMLLGAGVGLHTLTTISPLYKAAARNNCVANT
jgi:hypothetical protein